MRSALLTLVLLLFPALSYAEPVTAPVAATAETGAPVDVAASPSATAPVQKPVEAKKYPDTVVSGRVFAGITKKRGFEGGNGLGFDFKRFYIGVSHSFDERWSAAFISDIGDRHVTDAQFDPAKNKVALSFGKYDVFVKKAYLEFAPAKPAVLRIGASDMPWIPYVEALYGLRYVEQMMIDRVKFGTTTDWGLHFAGKYSVLRYALSAVHGGTYTNPSRPKTQDPDFEGRLAVEPGLGLVFAVGGYYGYLSPSVVPVKRAAERIDGFAGYVSERFRMGYEYFVANNWKAVSKGDADRARGYTAWGSALIVKPFSLFARYDKVRLTENTDPKKVETYLNTGVEYKVNKALSMAAVYKNTALKDVSAHEYGVWMDFKF